MRPINLDVPSRLALEFDALLELVAGYARTELGASRVRALVPACDAETVRERIETVDEIRRFLQGDGRLVPGFLPDPRPAIEQLSVAGACPEALALRDLATMLAAAGELRRSVGSSDIEPLARLRSIAGELPRFEAEAGEILRDIEPDGSLADSASAELRRIRRSIVRVGDRLRRMLEGILRRPDVGAVLQDDFVTQRNGRFVIPVRSDAPREVRGIVHASSSSGATQFVEPLESVDLNNELVRLAEREEEERQRILLRWADNLRDRLGEIRQVADAVGRVDSLQARALFGEDNDGWSPIVREDGPIHLRDLRHPLLDRRLRDAGERCVPLSLGLDPFDRVLVISGPNAGGKTVALKALGLAVLSAQCGIPVTAGSADLPLYTQIRADIGDHQSIDADLSTFSAHVQAVARFLEEASPPALLLFDEIGTGTEPTEGAALAQAVLERLRSPGLTAVATTHHGSLKAWAFTEQGGRSAAMEFDRDTLQPTYRILPDAAGVSAGLEIASRMGIPRDVVRRSRELLGPDTRQSEAYLERLRRLTAELEERRAALERLERETERRAERQATEARREADRLREETRSALEGAVQTFRKEVSREFAAIRERRERDKLSRQLDRVEREALRKAERQLAAVRPAGRGDGPERVAVEPVAGRRVHVIPLDREGEVVSVRGDKVEVRLGGVGFTVRRSDLASPPASESPLREREARPTVASTRSGRSPRDDLGGEVATEIHLLGKTVDEAIPELDKFLDAAALSGYGEVRVIHGHGTGRLRAGVRRFLSGHPHVRGHRPGGPGEGGDGATVVILR